MAFYIKPPSGNTRYDQLAAFGRKRLQFLHQVLNCEDVESFQTLLQQGDTAENSDCLIEGTKKDRISHFFLRLACANDYEMTSFLIKSETHLFCLRFASMNSAELKALLRSTYKFVHHLVRRNISSAAKDNMIKSAEDLHLVLSSALGRDRSWESVVSKYMDNGSDVITVPFQYALSLVRVREVILIKGMALVPYAKLHQILACLFEQIVRDGLKRAKTIFRSACEDERMADLFKELRHQYYAGHRIGSSPLWEPNPIWCNTVDSLEETFPPCMQNLHTALRQKHRLKHFSRIQYTLFLKEIGMPVQEAIRFWQREYSQTASSNHRHSVGCDHSWAKDSKRYTYNIRHLYGMEGSRINYSAHSCYAMQNCSLGHGEDGGCIFTHFDDRHLQTYLTSADISQNVQSSIFKSVQNKKYQPACETFFVERLKMKEEKKKLFKLNKSKLPVRDPTQFDQRKCETSGLENTSSHIEKPAFKETVNQGLIIGLANEAVEKTSNHIEKPVFKETVNQGLITSTANEAVEMTRIAENDCQQVDDDTGCRDRCDIDIEKPSDYFFSYRQLLKSLQSMK